MDEPISDPQRAALRRGRAMVVAAALLWSTSGAFVKSPPLAAIPQEGRGPLLACFRALSAAAVLAVFVRPRHVRWRPMLVPFVVSFASMNLLFVTALTRTTAAAAVFLQYTSTGWAFLFSALFLGERVGRLNFVALGCAMVGIWWIVAGDWTTQNFAGNWLALASGVCYAGVVVSLKWLRDEDPAWLVALCHAAAGLILLPIVLAGPLALGPLQWTLVVLLGVVQMGLPYVLFARSLRHVSTQEAALLTLIEPIANPIWVLLLWGETVPPSTWIGGGFIVGGLAVRYLFYRSPTPAAVAVAEARSTKSE
ncbi:MAG TPA: EamA family transporter [Planctomycetaceae bacterium]|jgi:drug/metabolite transporter (DMT)-like permease|nr:EamA family transporter [Planctomycetaceae bacterium]